MNNDEEIKELCAVHQQACKYFCIHPTCPNINKFYCKVCLENVMDHVHKASKISDAIDSFAGVGNEWDTLLVQYEQVKDACEEKELKYGALIRYLRTIQGNDHDGFFTEGIPMMNKCIQEIKHICQYV